jgi:hypothetical protein
MTCHFLVFLLSRLPATLHTWQFKRSRSNFQHFQYFTLLIVAQLKSNEGYKLFSRPFFPSSLSSSSLSSTTSSSLFVLTLLSLSSFLLLPSSFLFPVSESLKSWVFRYPFHNGTSLSSRQTSKFSFTSRGLSC